MYCSLVWILFCLSYAQEYVVDSSSAAQRFDGIGAVSGGGATSKLLYSYFRSSRERSPIMQALFNRETGVQMLKVEMGGDDQSTEGTEASHQGEETEQPTARSYEFRLIQEARHVNPLLYVCVLPWTYPHWLGKTPHDDDQKTAKYAVAWLQLARDEFSVDVNCIGDWNERNFSESYIRTLRVEMDKAGFNKVKIVAGEGFRMENGTYDRLLSSSFYNDYDVIGVHYPGGKIPAIVQSSGKTLWASEDFSTDNLETGEGCMARTLNWNFVHGNITGTLVWHLVSAFYKRLPWWRNGLAYLDEQEFRTERSFGVLQYTTSHAKPGWNFLRVGGGSGQLQGGGTYVGYTDGSHLSLVFETMGWNKSLCEYNNSPYYEVAAKQTIRFRLTGQFTRFASLNLSVNFGAHVKLDVLNGIVQFDLAKDAFGVLTSLPANVPQPIKLSVTTPKKYFDDFADYDDGEEPRFWMPQKGSWEVRGGVAVQRVLQEPILWCAGEVQSPFAVMSFAEAGTSIRAKVRLPASSSLARRVFVGLRSNCGGCDFARLNCTGIFVEIDFQTGAGTVFTHFVRRQLLYRFRLNFLPKLGTFYDFKVKLRKEEELDIQFNNFFLSLPLQTKIPILGFFVIGTSEYGYSHWDDVRVY